MIHKLSGKLANKCLKRHWIEPEQLEWLQYAIEKRFNGAVAFFILTVLAICESKPVEIYIYAVSVITLRRRLGGWHAKHLLTCQVFGLLVTAFCINVIGPLLMDSSLCIIVLLDLFILVSAFLANPIYPPQAHFSGEVNILNKKKKHYIVLVIILVQMLACFFHNLTVILYSMLGVATSLIALVIQTEISDERRKNHEKTGFYLR